MLQLWDPVGSNSFKKSFNKILFLKKVHEYEPWGGNWLMFCWLTNGIIGSSLQLYKYLVLLRHLFVFTFQPATTRYPSTPMTSSPTSRWSTRVGGEACAEAPTAFSRPTTWRFDNDDAALRRPVSPSLCKKKKKKKWEETNLLLSFPLFGLFSVHLICFDTVRRPQVSQLAFCCSFLPSRRFRVQVCFLCAAENRMSCRREETELIVWA